MPNDLETYTNEQLYDELLRRQTSIVILHDAELNDRTYRVRFRTNDSSAGAIGMLTWGQRWVRKCIDEEHNEIFEKAVEEDDGEET